MFIKIHKNTNAEVIAVCDENLIGKVIEDKNMKVVVSERFYKGEMKSNSEIIEILREAKNINLIGKETIDLAIKNGLINNKNIIKIKNIPHAQIFSI